jgi:hypothetical protein
MNGHRWIALVAASSGVACAGLWTAHPPPSAPARSAIVTDAPAPSAVDAPDAAPWRPPTCGGSIATVVPSDASTGDVDAPPTECWSNVRETHHRVVVERVAADVAVFTVIRDFERRVPSLPLCMDRDFRVGDRAVIDSFALQTDGAWRAGVLGPARDLSGDTPLHPKGPEERPWASLGWVTGNPHLVIPAFSAAHPVQVRYTLWAQGAPKRGAREWTYCVDDEAVVPDVVVSDRARDLVVHRDPEHPECVSLEKAQAPPTALSARYAAIQLDRQAWWWRIELAAPETVPADPQPPDAAPLVVVLDASRSTKRRGGVSPQLAIVRALARDLPGTEVELIRTSRTAERVFGRFVPAPELEAALASIPDAPLKNGSFLDRGAALAASMLREAGRPGRIVLMTDEDLRSRFDQGATTATLKGAPPGTIVHLLHPGASRYPLEVEHGVPNGLDAMSASLGGASYYVNVDERDPSNAELPSRLERLVRPTAYESLELDAHRQGNWPDIEDLPETATVIEAGETQVWGGVSSQPPPERASLVGWIWGKKVELWLRPDPAFQRIARRLATAEVQGGQEVECRDSPLHRQEALREGFLAPGLAFWVPGSGDLGSVNPSPGDWNFCDNARGRGEGKSQPQPVPDLAPEARRAVASCGVAPSPTGALRVRVETSDDEVLDVAVEGGTDEQRRCVEEALWAMELPDDFDGKMWWLRRRLEHGLTFSATPTPPPAP